MRPGQKHTEEAKRKVSEANKGRRHTKEFIEELRERMIGNKYSINNTLSKEHKEKLRIINMGNKYRANYRGWKHSIETRQKMSEAQKGDKSYLWMGGIASPYKMIRKSLKFKIWREKIFERDGYICQNCDKWGRRLHPHHIKSFSQIVKLNNIKTLEDALSCDELWDINNGITLCEQCHKQTDTYGKTMQGVNYESDEYSGNYQTAM